MRGGSLKKNFLRDEIFFSARTELEKNEILITEKWLPSQLVKRLPALHVLDEKGATVLRAVVPNVRTIPKPCQSIKGQTEKKKGRFSMKNTRK